MRIYGWGYAGEKCFTITERLKACFPKVSKGQDDFKKHFTNIINSCKHYNLKVILTTFFMYTHPLFK